MKSRRHAPHAGDSRTYSRNHSITLNGGQTVAVSASVDFKGDPMHADPEQLMVSALASCHMLTLLAIAEGQGYRVEEYRDNAVGYLEKGEGGMSMTRIEISPNIVFGGERVPDEAALRRLHAGAHRNCFIGRSIRSEVVVLNDGEPML